MSLIYEHYKQLTKLMDEKKVKDTANKLKSSALDLWTKVLTRDLKIINWRSKKAN